MSANYFTSSKDTTAGRLPSLSDRWNRAFHHTCRSTDGKLWSYKENKSFELELQAEYWPKFHAGSFRGHNAPLAEVAPTPRPAKRALTTLLSLFAIFLDFDVDTARILS
jgi:hypothetical protein